MREKGIHQIEIHVAGLCIHKDTDSLHILALHRVPNRTIFPNYWEGTGGQVHKGETLENAMLRHLSEEAGLCGRVICPFTTYVIDPKTNSDLEERIPGVRFLVVVEDQSGIVIDPKQHQEGTWIPEHKLGAFSWIPGLQPQIEQGLQIYRLLSEKSWL